ncbi:MAG: reverse transcriptase domain-containing protein, partial [Bacteroidota bacterium]
MADSITTQNQLHFLQWNINGLHAKMSMLKSEISISNADVIMLQECKINQNKQINFTGYRTFKAASTHGVHNWCNLVTLVKDTLPCVPISDPIQCGDQTEVLAVKILLANQDLTCYNLYKHPEGALDLCEIFNQASSEPTIISGDFNAHHPILCSTKTSEDGEHIASLLDDFPEVCLLNNGEPTHILGGRLDLTFSSTPLRDDARWQVHPTLTSDHFATLFSLKLSRLPPLPLPPSRWKQEFADWNKFQGHLANWHHDYSPPHDDDLLESDLVTALQSAADFSMPKPKPCSRQYKDHWYYDPEVKELKRRLNRARRIHKRRPTAPNKDQLREVALLVNKQINEIQANKWLEWCSNLHGHSTLRQIWAWLKRVAGKKTSTKITHPRPQQKAEELAEGFARRSDSTQLPLDTLTTQNNLNPERWNIINDAISQSAPTDTPYTLHELSNVKHKGKDTAPGADRITYTMISNLGEAGSKAYLHLLNHTHLQHTRPIKWNQQDTQPIPKPKDPEVKRPIALLSCLEKTGEKMVLNRLIFQVGPLHPNLYAYTNGIGTTECIMDVLSFIDHKPALLIFLDLEKAFELASPAAILFTLVQKGIKGHLLAWIKGYMLNRQARVRFQGHVSTFKNFENGTPQGGILSPFLFNLLMENFLTLPFKTGIQLFIYADDICIAARGPHKHSYAQHALNLIANQCKTLGLKINPTKSNAMAIKCPTPVRPLTIQGQNILWTEKTTYLGIIIDSKLTFDPQLKHLRARAKTRLAPLRSMSSLRQGCHENLLKKFYTATIRSLVDYAAPAFVNLKQTQKTYLEVAQNEAMRTILGAPMWTRICNLQMETGLPPLSARIESMNTSTTAKMMMSSRPSVTKTRVRHNLQLHPDIPTPKTYTGYLCTQIKATNMAITHTQTQPDTPHTNYTCPAPWASPSIQFHITKLPSSKRLCSPEAMLQAAEAAIQSLESPDSVTFFTDGSVDPETGRCGSAVYSSHHSNSWRVSDNCSTLQTELMAIKQALHLSSNTDKQTIIIHTDSLAAVQTLKMHKHKNNINLITNIMAYAMQLTNRHKRVVINWIPSHIGIHGNEEADNLAKSSLNSNIINCHIQPTLTQFKSNLHRYKHNKKIEHYNFWLQHSSPSALWYKLATELKPAP